MTRIKEKQRDRDVTKSKRQVKENHGGRRQGEEGGEKGRETEI